MADVPLPDIAKKNVILVVGSGQQRLRVSSDVLANAAPYFKTLFSPHFNEGQELAMNHGKEIAMPEDDAVGMFNMCCVIHSRNNLCMKDPTPSNLLAIATTADKFGCLEPMQFAANVWLSSMDPEKINRENPDIQGLAKLMAAAAMLDQPVAFQKITHQLMLHSNEPFDRLFEYIPDFDKSSLWAILFRLEEGRTRMRNRLQDIILSGLQDTNPFGDWECCWYAIHLTKVRSCLDLGCTLPSHPQPTGPYTFSVAMFLHMLKSTSFPSHLCNPSNGSRGDYYGSLEQTKNLEKGIQRFDNSKRGICLDCGRGIDEEGKVAQRSENGYRVPHQVANDYVACRHLPPW